MTLLAALLVAPYLLVPSKSAHGASISCLPSSLKSRLSQVRRKFGPIKVISTFRKNAFVRGTGRRSKHANCQAVDFKVRNKWTVYKWLTKHHNGGVGIYSGRCSHIHIDVGGRARWHHKNC